MRIWNTPIEDIHPLTWARMNLRRAAGILVDSRHTPAGMKRSRRSRRRWRGAGGVWAYDPRVMQIFEEYRDAYYRLAFA